MRIMLLVHGFNSLTQRLHVELIERGHQVSVEYDINDAVTRYAKQPASDMLDRHQQSVRLYQPVEDILENIFRVARIRHVPADEVEQPGSLPLYQFGNALIFLA